MNLKRLCSGMALAAFWAGASVWAGSAELLEDARTELAAGVPDSAVSFMRLALDSDPSNPELWQCLGDAYLKKGAPEKARIYFRRAASLRNAPEPAPMSASVSAATAQAWGNIFSDADELPSSPTLIQGTPFQGLGSGMRLQFKVPKGRHYAGVALPMAGKNLEGYGGATFWARRSGPGRLRMSFQVKDTRLMRHFASLDGLFSKLGPDWREFRISFDEFRTGYGSVLASVEDLAFIVNEGEGSLELDAFALDPPLPSERVVHSAMLMPPKKSETDFPAGRAAWCFFWDEDDILGQVAAINAGLPEPKKLKYLFARAGRMPIAPFLGATMDGDLKRVRRLAQKAPQGLHVLPFVDGSSLGAAQLSDAEWDALGRTLGAIAESQPKFFGLHLEFEPHTPQMHKLFAAVKRYTRKPLTVAVGAWDADTFRFSDLVVLMNYDVHSDPALFAQRSEPRIRAFLADAKAAGGRVMVGLPFMATHHEFEATAATADGAKTPSGHLQAEYTRAGLSVLKSAGAEREKSFMGVCIWALHPEGGLFSPSDTQIYFPSRMPAAATALLRDSNAP
jgi:hypothetical protein